MPELVHRYVAVSAVDLAAGVAEAPQFDIRDKRYRVLTQHSTYIVDDWHKLVGRNGIVAPGHVHGATFGGSLLLVDRLMVGALMEFQWDGRLYTSSIVTAIECAAWVDGHPTHDVCAQVHPGGHLCVKEALT